MRSSSATHDSPQRDELLKKSKKLAIITIIWNGLEAVCAIIFGLFANSVSLMAYGIDGCIELLSASVMLWRIRAEHKAGKDGAAEHEKVACRIIGVLLLLLSLYICIDSGTTLLGIQDKAQPSWPGVILTGMGLIVTPFLTHGKLKCSHKLKSGAQHADAVQSLTSCWLSLTAMIGLLLAALLDWSWADPVAALLFIPITLREGIDAVRCK
ncbi:MAG TPA: cation transporter [Planktothrix sp.]|jgi:divalent metal cation (Fe/Co/Zn/Cd) transporter